MHVVLVSTDEGLLSLTKDISKSVWQRHLNYLHLLQEHAPQSRLTILVVHKNGNYTKRTEGNLTAIPVQSRRLLSPCAVYRALKDLHAKDPISVITPQSPMEEGLGALVFARKNGVPIIGQLHFDIFSPLAHRDRTWVHEAWNRVRLSIARATLPFYNAWRVVAPALVQGLRGGYAVNNMIRVIPVPVPWLNDVPPVENSSHVPTVIFAGRLAPEKQLDQWLQISQTVFLKRPEAWFVIVGGGPLEAELKETASRLGITKNVTFAGHMASVDALIPLYQNAHVFLLTSSYEGFGRVIVEAAACGVPSVSYDVSGVRSIITNGIDGVLVPQGDMDAAAAAVIDLLDHPDKRQAMAEAAKQKVLMNYQPQALAESWVKMWLDCAKPSTNLLTHLAKHSEVL